MVEFESFNGVLAIHEFIQTLQEQGFTNKEIHCPITVNQLKASLNFDYGPSVETYFLLKEDVYVELGPPQYESVAYIAITKTPSEVANGRITLIGPDVSDVPGGTSLNFGQILLFGGSQIQDLVYREIEREIFHFKHLEGFMIRALPNKLWCRISKNVVFKGFSFETLGKALMIMYREKFPFIESMEILFLTIDSKQVFLELKVLGTEIRKTYIQKYSESLQTRLSKIVETVEKQRPECDYPWSCDECDYTAVCDEVRDILEKMKRYRKKTQGS
ncbi:MAG: hypothetical protein ACTSRS_02255 [Candidatus Helarchaeota archaeon]